MTKPSLPYGSDAPTTDYVGLAFAAMGFGVFLGTGLIAVVALVVRMLQAGQPPSASVQPDSGVFDVLVYGTGLALFAAGAATFTILRPIRSPYRQGGLALVATFAALVLSFLLTTPADYLAGRAGLAVVVVLAALGCAGVGRRIGRLSSAA